MLCTEIFKLRGMLERAEIPFEFSDRSYDGCDGREYFYQIRYPKAEINTICSVIQCGFSYGGNEDKLEIMGLLTDEERERDSVAGWLTAEDVFERIKNHYKSKERED